MQALIALCFKAFMEVIAHAIGSYLASPSKTSVPDPQVYLVGPSNIPTTDELESKYGRL